MAFRSLPVPDNRHFRDQRGAMLVRPAMSATHWLRLWHSHDGGAHPNRVRVSLRAARPGQQELLLATVPRSEIGLLRWFVEIPTRSAVREEGVACGIRKLDPHRR